MNEVFQYQALVEPFDAVLSESIVTVDMWYRETVWWIPPIHQTEEGFFTFNPEPIENPVAPDLFQALFPDFLFTIPPTPEGWFSIPVYPIPNVGDTIFVPKLGYRHDPHVLRNAINMMSDIFNSMIRSGRLRFNGALDWEIVITSDDVTQALGYTPEYGTPVSPPPPPPPPPSGLIDEIYPEPLFGLEPIVRTFEPHGLDGTAAIRISGTSNGFYNADYAAVDYLVETASTFRLISMGFAGPSIGGTVETI